jgi:hypothetical protein
MFQKKKIMTYRLKRGILDSSGYALTDRTGNAVKHKGSLCLKILNGLNVR